jgi:hypothetical protein
MGQPTYSELVGHLTEARVLSKELVECRAAFLAEDLARIDLKGFGLLPLESRPVPGTGQNYIAVEYGFGPVTFSAQNAGDPFSVRRTVQEMSGTGIDRGDLLYLSKISEIGRTLIPNTWFNNRELLRDLADPNKHISTLNEIWWLSVWTGFLEKGLQHDCKICSDSSKRIDWRFVLSPNDKTWFVNLEVKQPVHAFADRAYRKRHRFFTSRNEDGSLREDDPSLKFRESGPNEINVLAVTWFDEISPELESGAQEFLDGTNKVDVVLLWALGDERRGTWYRMYPRFRDISEKRALLHTVLKSPDEEDRSRIIWTIFPRTIDSILEESRSI